jgi:hypothetical protein
LLHEKKAGISPRRLVASDVEPFGLSRDLVGSALMFEVLTELAEGHDRFFNADNVDFEVLAGGKEDGEEDAHRVVWLVVVVALLASMWETYPAGSWPSIK